MVVGGRVAGPVDDQADKLLWVHMIQHLMLADVASLLIVLGFTGPLLQPLLTFRAGRPLRRLTHPVVAITVFTFNLYIWHIPFLYQAVLTDTSLHVLEHLLFLSTGILLWMPLFGPLPKPQWFGKGAHVIYTVGIWAAGDDHGQRLHVVGHRLLPRLHGDRRSGRDHRDRRPEHLGRDPDGRVHVPRARRSSPGSSCAGRRRTSKSRTCSTSRSTTRSS